MWVIYLKETTFLHRYVCYSVNSAVAVVAAAAIVAATRPCLLGPPTTAVLVTSGGEFKPKSAHRQLYTSTTPHDMTTRQVLPRFSILTPLTPRTPRAHQLPLLSPPLPSRFSTLDRAPCTEYVMIF